MMDKMTAKQKLDQMFGIPSDGSVDDFLNKLSSNPDQTVQQMSEGMNDVANGVKDALSKVDQGLAQLKTTSNIAPETLVDLNSSMQQVEELISLSKDMFKHIYEAITTTDLVDSELVSSASQLLTAIHENMSEFIMLYKERQAYIDNIRILVLKQEQKKELMALKQKYDIEKLQAKLDNNATDTNAIAFSVAEMTKMLNDADEEMMLELNEEEQQQEN